MAVYLGNDEVNVFGGQPNGACNLQTKSGSYTPTESPITDQITPDAGYDGLDEVDVTVNAIPSNYIGSGVPQKSSSDLTVSGGTVTAPSGYYANNASKSVASGTEGTPIATKGAVNNHAIEVTPSVTNVGGYISGGSHTGNNVSVSASELVSGTLQVSSNGTYDVTNYEDVEVNVSGGGGGGMNVQGYHGMDYVRASSYTATDVTLTVAKTGTYKISWMGFRNTTSGTSGSQLYINGTAYGSAHTSFTSSYGQSVILTNVSLNVGDVLVVRARARSSSYYMYVGNLIIEQTA